MKISVTQAAAQIGIDEAIYRLAMAEMGIKDADTVKEIDLDSASKIADAAIAPPIRMHLRRKTIDEQNKDNAE